MSTRLDVLYYEITTVTEKFDIGVARARRQVASLQQGAAKPLVMTADTADAEQNLAGLTGSLGRTTGASAIATAALLGLGAVLIDLADNYQLVNGRLKLVTNGTGELALAQSRLFEIANDTLQGYGATADIYSRLARNSKELGLSQRELFEVTESVTTAVRLSGVSASAAEAGLIQLGQAFASGTLRGDELRSVLEQLPRVAQAIADGMGVTVGELRALGEAGALTSADVAKALKSQIGTLRTEAAQLGPTLGQAYTVFKNSIAQYIGDTNEATGATRALASGIQFAAKNFDALVNVVLLAGAAYTARGLAPMVAAGGQLIAQQARQVDAALGAAQAQVTSTAALVEATTAQRALTAARLADLEATRAAIELSRQEVLAQRTAAQAYLARAVNPTQLAPLGGAAVARETARQAAEQATLARTTRELAQLGQQQTRVTREIAAATAATTIATQAATVASTAHTAAIAGTSIAARAGAVAMGAFRGAIAFLGGPIGAAITVALVGIAYAIHRVKDANEEAAKQAARAQEALEKLSDSQLRSRAGELEAKRIELIRQLQSLDGSNPGALNRVSVELSGVNDELATVIERFKALNVVTKRAADIVGEELADDIAEVNAKLAAFSRGGETSADAFDEAARRWKDATTANRTFTKALADGDPVAKSLLERTKELVLATNRLEAAQDSAKDRAEKLKQAHEAMVKIDNEFAKSAAEAAKQARAFAAELESRPEKARAAFSSGKKAQEEEIERLQSQVIALAAGREAYERLLVRQRQATEVQAALDAARREGLQLNPQELDDLKARIAELERLKKEVADLQQQLGIKPPKLDAKNVDGLSDGIGRALSASQSLALSLGDVGDKIASALDGAQELASALIAAQRASAAADAAAKSGGGTGESKGSAVSKAATGIVIIGAFIGIAQALDLFGTKAAERRRELQRLAEEFNNSLALFGRRISETDDTESQRKRNALAEEIGEFARAAAASVGFGLKEGVRFTAEGLDQYINQLRDEAQKQFDRSLNRDGSNLNNAERQKAAASFVQLEQFARALEEVRKKALEAEAALRQEQAAKLAERTQSLEVRRLQAAGLSEEADALQRRLDAAEEVRAAEDELLGAEGLVEYLRALREIQAAEAAAAAATAAAAAAMNEFSARTRLFGLSATEALTGLVAVYTQQFARLDGLLSGIDVSAEGGLEALRTRIRAIFDELAEGGITESEQKLVDALLAILGAAETAADGIESVAERLASALSNLEDDNDILGGSAQERFGRLKKIASGFSNELADILSELDFGDSGSVEGAKTKLRDLYLSLAEDGISEAERPIVDLIRRLLGEIGDVIDEGQDLTDEKLAELAAARKAKRDAASQDIALGDLTGSDAFQRTLEGLGERFRNLLGGFDVTSIDGVESATGALRNLLLQVRNGTIDLSQFGDMTRDEIIDAILELDGSLDDLGDVARDAAAELQRAADAQREFTEGVDVDYLRATGQNREADIAVLKAETAEKVRRAKELGVAHSVIDTIIKSGELKLAALDAKYAADASKADSAAPESSASRRSEFISSAVTQISSEQALRITDYLASSLVEQRTARVGIQQLVGLMSAMVSGTIPTLSVPALPPSLGAVGGAAGAGAFVIQVIVNGPISGMSPDEAGRQIGEAAAPYVDAFLSRSAGIQSRVAGRTLS